MKSDLQAALDVSPREAVRVVLQDWYGATRASVEEIELSLSGLSRIAETWPVFRFNDLFDPPENEGDRLLFLAENQGVVLWAADGTTEDASVFIRVNEPGEDWSLEGERLATFALQAILVETVLASDCIASADAISDEELGRSLTQLRELKVAPWSWPESPARFYYSDSILATSTPNPLPDAPTGYSSVLVAATDTLALNRVAENLEGDWRLT